MQGAFIERNGELIVATPDNIKMYFPWIKDETVEEMEKIPPEGTKEK